MEFNHPFSVPKPLDEVWQTMTNLEKVIPCVPNATVVEASGPKSAKAQIKMRLGSMSMTYTGPAEIVNQDDGSHHAVMTAKAQEAGGQGNADARVEISLSADGGSTKGTLKSTINVTGKAAQMGEGTIEGVTNSLIEGFASNLAKI
jgi:carbon monoxide dehydrogenase subunit G